jgi:hypothetical protein
MGSGATGAFFLPRAVGCKRRALPPGARGGGALFCDWDIGLEIPLNGCLDERIYQDQLCLPSVKILFIFYIPIRRRQTRIMSREDNFSVHGNSGSKMYFYKQSMLK